MTYFQYGSYTHPRDEVVLSSMEIIPTFSARGRRTERLYRLHLVGNIVETGSALLTRIQEIANVYAFDFQDAGLYMDDGTLTPHKIPQNHPDNISGVRVAYRSWPVGDAAELATTRTFSIRLEATFREPTSEIVFFQESVRAIGDCGPRWVAIPQAVGPPVYRTIAQATTQMVIQSGIVVGYDAWPLPRVPSPYYPSFEHTDERIMELTGPRYRGNGFTDYTVRWSYRFELPQAYSTLPTSF